VHRFFLAEYSDLGLGWILGRGWGRLGEDVEVIVLDLEGIGPHGRWAWTGSSLPPWLIARAWSESSARTQPRVGTSER
jgi:hypothetical protein